MQNYSPPSPPSRGATPNSASAGPPLPAPAPSYLPSPQSPDYPSSFSISAALNGFVQHQDTSPTPSTPEPNPDVDPQIVEALKSKDRIFVLKMGETMESLIREPSKIRMDVTAATSYQRMLVHRCASFYKTSLEVDQITKAFCITLLPDSRIPERKISDLVPAEPAPQPAIKIMQRTSQDRKPKSQADSVAGDDLELSDVEPSETGSLGGRSTSTSGHTKKRPTIEEREAAYKEARSRIFMGFEEKEKGSMNASSSSLSLTSSSAGAGSSVGDLEESSSPTTESEWSASNVRENRKDFRRGSGASSSRNGLPNFSGPTSVRNSRASSPSSSFKFASIYDPTPSTSFYDPHGAYPEPLNPGYHPSQYPAPYPPPGHPSNIPFTPYPFYPQYNPYPPPPQPQQHPIEGMLPTNGDMYGNPMGHGNNFVWQNPNPPPPHMQHSQPPMQPHPGPNQMINAPPHPGQGPRPPFMQYPGPPYPYPIPGYYPPPNQMAPLLPNPPPLPVYDMSRPPNGSVGPLNPGRPVMNNATGGLPNNGRNHPRVPLGPSMNGTSKGRSSTTRSSWSYGPGVGTGGFAPSQPPGDVVGPRLSSSRRQGSGSGSGSGSSGYSRTSSLNDDVSSTTSSSTTSSSSRRTYTSTSSQHPLPARPDWAVGITPASNPLHIRHHHDHSSRPMPPVNSMRNGNNTGPPINMSLLPSGPASLPPLHPTDFPPLTSAAIPERRSPNTMGAWSNSNIRSVLSPNQVLQQQHHPSAKPYPNFTNNMPMHHFDEPDRSFERPPPKSAELYNHKSGKKFPTNNSGGIIRTQDYEMDQGPQNDALAEQMTAMSIGEQGLPVVTAAAPQESIPIAALTIPA